MHSRTLLKRSGRALWGRSGAFWGHSGALSGRSGNTLGHSRNALGGSGTALGSLWGALEALWGALEVVWGIRGRSGSALGRSWGALKRLWRRSGDAPERSGDGRGWLKTALVAHQDRDDMQKMKMSRTIARISTFWEETTKNVDFA